MFASLEEEFKTKGHIFKLEITFSTIEILKNIFRSIIVGVGYCQDSTQSHTVRVHDFYV